MGVSARGTASCKLSEKDTFSGVAVWESAGEKNVMLPTVVEFGATERRCVASCDSLVSPGGEDGVAISELWGEDALCCSCWPWQQ